MGALDLAGMAVSLGGGNRRIQGGRRVILRLFDIPAAIATVGAFLALVLLAQLAVLRNPEPAVPLEPAPAGSCWAPSRLRIAAWVSSPER